jgi:protein-tyrosine phosphatase
VNGYIDLHAHVLPGIDDGPPDLDESLAMLSAAAASGITTIAATPHLRADFPDVHVGELANRCAELRAAIMRAGLEIGLVSGAEVSLVWALEASDDELRLATYDQRGSDLLIETPTVNAVGLGMLLYDLRAKGLRITLAHPERSAEFQRDPARLGELVSQGVLLQVNADSLLDDRRGSSDGKLGRQLCADGLAHALASDGHRSTSWRPVTRLARGAEAATALVGVERAQWMLQAAPAAIIAGSKLPDPPAIVAHRRWGKLFGGQR